MEHIVFSWDAVFTVGIAALCGILGRLLAVMERLIREVACLTALVSELQTKTRDQDKRIRDVEREIATC